MSWKSKLMSLKPNDRVRYKGKEHLYRVRKFRFHIIENTVTLQSLVTGVKYSTQVSITKLERV